MSATDRQALSCGNVSSPALRKARRRLLREVLGVEDDMPPGSRWTPFARFEPGGRCVGTLEAATLPLVVEGLRTQATGIRSVAVHPDWRGQGLFRDLMVEALAWCESRTIGPTLLYTETSSLYERFGFRTMPQHAFVGAAPAPHPSRQARRLDIANRSDIKIIETTIARRASLSSFCALEVEASAWIANVARDDALTIAYLEEAETIVVFETDADTLVIADVVGAAMPSLAIVVGAVGLTRPRIKTLFPPDALDWRGVPDPEETGLMIRGPVPAAMTRPFMFPPTAEF